MDIQVVQCLQATLSPDETTRRSAEDQLAQLFLHPEGGLSLTRVLTAKDAPLPQRQITGVLLQKYVRKHWSAASDDYEEPISSQEIKAQIRPLILTGLSDPESKIRLAAAYTTSSIARYDWPDQWPDLLPILISLLHGDAASVHGSMRVISEFFKEEVSEDQLLPIVRDLVPVLLSILADPHAHSFSTRASTVNVYRHILSMLSMVKTSHPGPVRQALDQIAPVWFNAFIQLLSVDAASDVAVSWQSLALRIQIFRVLLHIHASFPKYLTHHIPTFLRLSVLTLTSLLPTFQSYYISTSPSAPSPPESSPDSSLSEPKMDLDDLACAVIEFLDAIVRTNAAKPLLVEGENPTVILETLMSLLLAYTQITRENEEEWLDDMNAFVEDGDEENVPYGVRFIGYDLLGSLIDLWPRIIGRLLANQGNKRVQESLAAKHSGDKDWWKPLEAVLALVGAIADDIRNLAEEDKNANREPTFPLASYFDQIVPGLLDQSETPFLQGRAFVFAGDFAQSLGDQLAAQYLGAAVNALKGVGVSIPVRISAVKTVKNFCRFISPEILRPQAGQVLSVLLPLLSETSDETLYLFLETVHSVISLDKELLNPENTVGLCQVIYDEWLKNSTDPVATAVIEEITESITLSPNPKVVQAAITFLGPRLAELITNPTTDESLHIPGEAVQLSNALIRRRPGPLEVELVGSVTGAVVGCLLIADDMDVIQHGMIHLTLVVRKDCEKLVQWHDTNGTDGITSIFHILARCLQPTFSESGGIFVGELIMHLFRKATNAMGPILGDLLRAIVGRIATAELPFFKESLVVPFAYLFGTEHTQNTLDLLSGFNVTTLDGSSKSALEVVLTTWCEAAETLSGTWNTRVNDIGLAKLFALGSPIVQRVLVKGDMIIDETNRNTIMTRSRAKKHPNRYTQIPFPVKALKLLLKTTERQGKSTGKNAGEDFDIEDDDGDEEWDDDDPLGTGDAVGEFGYLSDWLDAGNGETTEEDDDEDLKADPLAQIDLGQYVSDIIRRAYASNDNGIHEMVESLTDSEKASLRAVLTI